MDPGPKVAAHRSARPRNGLPCPSRLARRLRFSARKRLCAACRASNRRTSRCIHPSPRSSSDRLPAACLWLRREWGFRGAGSCSAPRQATHKVGILILLTPPSGGTGRALRLPSPSIMCRSTRNKSLEAFLKEKGVADDDIMINYTPFGHSDWQTIVSDIKKFGSAGKKTAVVSTINGDANVPFYKELGNQGVKATDIPSVAFSVGEEELAGIDTKPLLGHLAAWNYFPSIKTPINHKFIADWKAFIKNPKRVTNDPMEAHVISFAMRANAVEKAKSTDPDKVIDTLARIKAPNLNGRTSEKRP